MVPPKYSIRVLLVRNNYFQVPERQNSLNASDQGNLLIEGNFIELKVTIQKPSDAEGSESYLAGGDSFNIQLTEDGYYRFLYFYRYYS